MQNPDYYPSVKRLAPFINEDLREVLKKTSGPAMVHLLSQHLEYTEQLSKLTPGEMGAELAKIELRFKQGKPLPKRAKPKPAPTAENIGTTSGKQMYEMTDTEYAKFMAKEAY